MLKASTAVSQRATSISDLARAAGLSQSIVSRALRGNSLISPEVRERVQRLAREMGYTPSDLIPGSGVRTQTIGLVVTSIADPFWADVMGGVEEVARPAGFSVFLSASHNDPSEEAVAIETFHRRRVDGLLVADSRIDREMQGRFADTRVPTVLINRQVDEPHDLVNSVMVDDYLGAQLAVNHLLALGHRRIGYMGAGNRRYSNTRRHAGYADALRAAGVTPAADWTAIAPAEQRVHLDDTAAGQQQVLPLLAVGVTAIFCYNDMLAVGALMSCRERGVAVPADLSVVGFDDIGLSSYVSPPLTTIAQPRQALGRAAMQMLLNLVDGCAVQSEVLLPALVARKSTAAPPKR